MAETSQQLHRLIGSEKDLHVVMLPGLATELGYHINTQEKALPLVQMMDPEYCDEPVEHTVAAHALGFVSAQALDLKLEVEQDGIELTVLDEKAALDGLKEYYAQLRDTSHKNAILAAQQDVLRTTGRAYAESHITMAIHRSLQPDQPPIPSMDQERRKYLAKHGMLDVVGALGMAIQPPPPSARKYKAKVS